MDHYINVAGETPPPPNQDSIKKARAAGQYPWNSSIDAYSTAIRSTVFRLHDNKTLGHFVYDRYVNIMFRWMDLFVDYSTFDQGCVNIEKTSKIPITHPHTIVHNFLLEMFD